MKHKRCRICKCDGLCLLLAALLMAAMFALLIPEARNPGPASDAPSQIAEVRVE